MLFDVMFFMENKVEVEWLLPTSTLFIKVSEPMRHLHHYDIDLEEYVLKVI